MRSYRASGYFQHGGHFFGGEFLAKQQTNLALHDGKSGAACREILKCVPINKLEFVVENCLLDFRIVSSIEFRDQLVERANSYASAGVLTPIIIDFKNSGGNDQANVPVSAIIKDQTGIVVYRDTEYAVNWLSGQLREVTFKNWSVGGGPHTFCGIALLPTDQLRSDDTVCEQVLVRYDYDAAAIGIVNPKPNEQKPYTLSWQPTALMQSHGAQDLFDVPARVQIRRCSDGALVFQADSICSPRREPGVKKARLFKAP